MKYKLKLISKQVGDNFTDEFVVETYAKYTINQDKHSVEYRENTSDVLLEFTEKTLFMKRKGESKSELYFVEGEKTTGIYETIFGSFNALIETKRLGIEIDNDLTNIHLDYDLKLGDVANSKFEIKIEIRRCDE